MVKLRQLWLPKKGTVYIEAWQTLQLVFVQVTIATNKVTMDTKASLKCMDTSHYYTVIVLEISNT